MIHVCALIFMLTFCPQPPFISSFCPRLLALSSFYFARPFLSCIQSSCSRLHTHQSPHHFFFLVCSLSLLKEQRCICVPAFFLVLLIFFIYFFSGWGCNHCVEFWFACHFFFKFLIFLPPFPSFSTISQQTVTEQCFLKYNTMLKVVTK